MFISFRLSDKDVDDYRRASRSDRHLISIHAVLAIPNNRAQVD
jgi:hypothetical protein